MLVGRSLRALPVMLRRARGIRRSRIAVVAAILAGHAGVLWLAFDGQGPKPSAAPMREAEVFLLPGIPQFASERAPPMQQASVEVPPPRIEIDTAPDSNAISASYAQSGQQHLAPRPDPMHTNEALERTGLQQAANLVLRVLVRATGVVADAEVVRSSGDSALDALAIQYVIAHWRFLPAQTGERPVDDWTTVFVPVQPRA